MTRPQEDPAVRMSVAFVGTLVSGEACARSVACSVAGNKYQQGFVKGVERALGRPVHVVSVRPVPMWPGSEEVLVRGSCDRVGERSVVSVPFLNVPVLKQVSVFLALFWHVGYWLRDHRSSARRVVVVYNLFSPFSLSVLLARRLFGGTTAAIVADLAHGVYQFKGWRGVLERLDLFVQTRSMRLFDGLIVLSSRVVEDFAAGRPSMVLEGGVELGACGGGEQVEPATVLYSGALNNANGVDNLLDGFRLIDGEHYRLVICGRGPLAGAVQQSARDDPRVVAGGHLSEPSLIARQSQATCLINPRPVDQILSRYTFPSKVLEYMASGRPTISTRLPSIPDEYEPFLVWVEGDSPQALALAIEEACSRDPAELDDLGARARAFVMGQKNWDRQGERAVCFLCRVCELDGTDGGAGVFDG